MTHISFLKRSAVCAALALLLAGCNCNPPLRITPIQRSDKKLSCRGLVLEINEAEHYRVDALRSVKGNAVKLYQPTCMLTGPVAGASAVRAANSRIEYLGRIYDLLGCAGRPMMDADDLDDGSD